MFSGYNLTLHKSFFGITKGENKFNYYKKLGKDHLKRETTDYCNKLDCYISNETLDGSQLQNDCFPQIEANVFISHSHNDKNLANALAGWIYETFGLKVFIDSNVWKYADKILEEINVKYSKKRKNRFEGGFLYNHQDCIYSSQHVNIMLSIALQKMIDKVECVILLNTNNSIKVFDNINQTINKTYSPWIYSEIVCTEIIQKKPLLLYRNYPLVICDSTAFESTNYINAMALRVTYDVSLKHLTKLTENDLYEWKCVWNNISPNDKQNEIYPLDYLYKKTHAFELESTKQLFKRCSTVQMKRLKKFLENRYSFNDNSNELSCSFGCEGCQYEKCPLYVNSEDYLRS